ncbi:hypothetical protein EP47_13510 [Legionella norrlandica]|uniref:Uncharacterized protein n=1 Tax=Legionella norrlandica TaxID=1498499 RepID=A0A0A2T5J9_9GAMM|nr:2'-5' RNA ligase family protein [Legionella norrlandica]KGP62718.1 hypothetical protein EP47_13510 [Legionella norrlandica]
MKLSIRIIVLFLMSICSYAKEINVYLLFEEPGLHQSVKEFNSYLEKNDILKRYQIEPFLEHHPLHITLFLADYSEPSIEELKHRVSLIAKHWHPIAIKTTNLLITAGNYVMLDVDNSKQHNGLNSELQRMSDDVTMRLTELRNFGAKIPDWAESIPEKKKAFIHYGSPNVFFEYSPHFSLMAKNFSDPSQSQEFHKELSELIQTYYFPKMQSKSHIIAMGYVDSYGQITQEIARFTLND